MIIGFGFGSPLIALLMLIITGFLSYSFFKMFRKSPREFTGQEQLEDVKSLKEKRRKYYYEQRQNARELMGRYDLTDEEIEKKVEEEFK